MMYTKDYYEIGNLVASILAANINARGGNENDYLYVAAGVVNGHAHQITANSTRYQLLNQRDRAEAMDILTGVAQQASEELLVLSRLIIQEHNLTVGEYLMVLAEAMLGLAIDLQSNDAENALNEFSEEDLIPQAAGLD